MSKTRIAVVGLGKMGLMHASIFSMLEGVELVALCEKSSFIRKFSRKVLPKVNIIADLQELSSMNLDAVCVTTPPGSHFPIIKQVISSGIARNVFTEKPLATNHAQSRELCELANATGGANMVGYHRRFSVVFKKAQDILAEGILGQLTSFEGYAYSADFLGAKPAQSLARGGVLEDSGVHVADLALWLLGDMEVKNAKITSLLGGGTEDEIEFELATLNGLRGKLVASWCKEGYRLPEMALKIVGANGTLDANEDRLQLKLSDGTSNIWYRHDLDDTVPFFIGGSEYQRQDNLFIKAIQESTSVEPCFFTASRVERLVDHVNEIARGNTGK